VDKHAVEELKRCGKDPVYFILNYVKIRHPTKGLIPFKMFHYQDQLVKDYIAHRFNIVLKGRQLGISEITAAFAAWLMIFKTQRNVLVMATKADTAKNIIKKVHTALKHVPKWMVGSRGTKGSFVNLDIENKTSLELSNGSVIKAIAASDDAGRSEAVSFLIIDEAAFVPNLDELWTGLYPTVQAGGRVAILSTPNGVGNKFHELYTEAEKGVNEFHATKLMWWEHPERVLDKNGNYDLKDDPERPGFKTSSWFRNEIKAANLSPRQVSQEYECNFNASGDTVISGEHLAWVSECVASMPLKRMELPSRTFHVWIDPEPNEKYMVSVDVARGDGRDYSAAIVWRLRDMWQVAEYYDKVPPDELALMLCGGEMGDSYWEGIAGRYNNAILVVENNTIGLACLEHVRLLGYENVYFSRRHDQKPGETINMRWGTYGEDLIPGFTTSPKTRPLIIAKLEEYIRNRNVVIRSKRMLEELRSFVWTQSHGSTRAEAMKGYNDDLVMAAAIGIWIRDTYIAPSAAHVGIHQKMIDCISTKTKVHTDIPGVAKDPRFVPQRALGSFISTSSQSKPQIKLQNGEVVDFSWLISVG
jgi:hypothetical protein